MSKKKNIRVCMKANNKICKLFSIVERNDGDLVISLNSAENFRVGYKKNNVSQPQITHQKYSVHCSNQSQTNINVLKHQLKFDKGEEKVTQHFTKAIKQTNKFAPLFGARAPDLFNVRYEAVEDEKNIVLANFNTKKATPFYLVSVCNKKAPPPTYFKDYNFQYIKFSQFNLLILWSFINLPSHDTGFKLHFLTKPPEDLKDGLLRLEDGFSPDELLSTYQYAINTSILEFADTLIDQYPDINKQILDELLGLPFTAEPIVQA